LFSDKNIKYTQINPSSKHELIRTLPIGQQGETLRSSPVAKAEPSPAAKRKVKKKHTDDGLPVHSFRTLLDNLATLTRNTMRCGKAPEMTLLARSTEIQQRAFDLLGTKLTV
jgi:hypothetical protein